MSNNIRLVFAGGGTGGHLFPAIAIADRVSELLETKVKVEIQFVGTRRGIEFRLRDSLGYKLNLINMRGINRSLSLKNLLVPFAVISSMLKCHSLMNSFNPHLVVGTGGYVCWPVLKAAAWKKIPTVIQEQNSFPGITTRQLAGEAKKIYLGFDTAREHLVTQAEIITTGNPIRPEMKPLDRKTACEKLKLDPLKKTILILGGSQGARAINNAVLKSLNENKLDKSYQLLWQTGKRDYQKVLDESDESVKGSTLIPFAKNMAELYSAADIIIARAGALTLAEIMFFEKPSILIPFPHAAGDHQRKNADDMVKRNLALFLDENDLENKNLLNEAITHLESADFLNMLSALKENQAGKKPAVDIIAEDIIAQLSEFINLENTKANDPSKTT